jgi:hypothetical protein
VYPALRYATLLHGYVWYCTYNGIMVMYLTRSMYCMCMNTCVNACVNVLLYMRRRYTFFIEQRKFLGQLTEICEELR